MNRQVVQMVRSLDMQATQAHMCQTTGTPFVPETLQGERRVLHRRRERANRAAQDAHAIWHAARDLGQPDLATRPRPDRAL